MGNPDIAGFATPGGLQTVALTGGPPQILAEDRGFLMAGADWSADGTIVYGTNRPGGALMQISAAGGQPTALFTPDDQRRSSYPQILPGGDPVLFTLSDAEPDAGDLYVLVRETGLHRLLLSNGAAGRVLDSGHLVFVRTAPYGPSRSTVSVSKRWGLRCRSSSA